LIAPALSAANLHVEEVQNYGQCRESFKDQDSAQGLEAFRSLVRVREQHFNRIYPLVLAVNLF
jgi:hypothetical protein